MNLELPDWISQVLIADFALLVIMFLTTWILATLARRILRTTLLRIEPKLVLSLPEYGYLLVWLIGTIVYLAQIGFSTTILFFVFGFAALLVLISTKGAFQNIFARPFLDLYGKSSIGDVISIEGLEGEIVEINPLNTVFVTRKDELVNVPNYIFLKKVSVNKKLRSGHAITVTCIVSKTIDEVELDEKLRQECTKIQGIMKKPVPHIITTRIDKHFRELLVMVHVKDIERKNSISKAISEKAKAISERINSREERAKKETWS